MKKTLLALAFGALCAASFSSAATADTIRVGTHPTFAPFEFTDTEGQIIGFDLDIIKAIAKSNGDEVQIESMPFDGLIPSLLTGNLDAIISGMTITEERQKRVSFSEGYYDSVLSIIIKTDKADTYKTADDLKGQTICVQIGTTGHALADQLSPGKVKALNNEPDAILELSNGGCEAVINDRPVNLYYLNTAQLSTLTEFVDPSFKEKVDKFGIAVRKDNQALVDKINAGLAKLEESGELDQIYVKWFGQTRDGKTPETAPEGTVANIITEAGEAVAADEAVEGNAAPNPASAQ